MSGPGCTRKMSRERCPASPRSATCASVRHQSRQLKIVSRERPRSSRDKKRLVAFEIVWDAGVENATGLSGPWQMKQRAHQEAKPEKLLPGKAESGQLPGLTHSRGVLRGDSTAGRVFR